MKKYNLFKVLGITIIAIWLLTLFIPGSYLDYSGNIVKDTINGVGIFGLLSNTNISITYFNSIAVFLIAVAIFYSVLSKLDVYNNFVDKTVQKFEGKTRLLVIITTVVFALLSVFVSNNLILIAFIPFIYNVMKKLGVDKKAILSSTIVASFIGSMGRIYDNGLFSTFSLEINTLLLVKVILVVISLFILILFIAPKEKKTVKESKKTTKAETKKADAKKVTSKKETVKVSSNEKKVKKGVYAVLTILFGTIGINKFYTGKIKQGILCILFSWTLIPTILSIVEFITILTIKSDKNGMIKLPNDRVKKVKFIACLILFTLFVIGANIPWESIIKDASLFTDFNTWLSKLAIGKYSVFSNLIGTPTRGATSGVISVFGSWSITDISILLVILTVVIALFEDVKFDKLIAYSTEGIKKVLPVAITAMFVSIVLVLTVTTGINVTISNAILTITKGFNIATTTLCTMVGSIITGDYTYFVSTLGNIFVTAVSNKDYYGVVAFIIQSIFYLMMLVVPTSTGLIIGLYYLDIPYGKWIKYIWKAFLSIFVVSIIIAIVIFALV